MRKELHTELEDFNELNQYDQWSLMMFLYRSALSKIKTKVKILQDEFSNIQKSNPIEHVNSRIKTPQSIVRKMHRQGIEVTIENMVEYINDIAGIRIVCSFTPDIYKIAEMLSNQQDITVLLTKDYIKNPKANGYRSYHMIISIPVYLSKTCQEVKVEVQIRTIAMDFWASLEHKIHYKFSGNAPEYMTDQLKDCADIVAELDNRMLALNRSIQKEDAVPPTYSDRDLDEDLEMLSS